MDNQLNTQEESNSSDQEKNKMTGKRLILTAISVPVSVVAMLIIYWFFK
jgi:flagellar basal body-associated protein FliL